MNLLKKINRNYLISSAVVLAVGLAAFYFLINYIASSEIEESLYASEQRVIKQIKNRKSLPYLYPIIEVEKVNTARATTMKDTAIFDQEEGEGEIFKELNTYPKVNGQFYHITVRALTVEKRDIVMSFFMAITLIFLLLIGALYYINKQIAVSVWKPFYDNLERLKSFSLKANEKIALRETNITEFNELNQSISHLTDKIISDYNSLKEFTQNASHELQTPLAVIQAKIENLLNNANLSQEQMSALHAILQSISRLSRLNNSLLLLTKIENKQFSNTEMLEFGLLIRENLDTMKELFAMRKIIPDLQVDSPFQYSMDKTLFNLMVNNLLKNQLMHTPQNGKVFIRVQSNQVLFANSGTQALKDKHLIFDRFYKESHDDHSTGLGLALVKKVCDVSGLKVDYTFDGEMHQFRISL
jgi:two-component system OmpR family sensor kinase